MNYVILDFLYFPMPAIFLLIVGLGFLSGKWRSLCVGLAMASLLVLAFPATSKLLVRPLLIEDRGLAQIKEDSPDVILVPTGGIRQIGDNDYMLTRSSGARLAHAGHLQTNLQIPVILSGGDVLNTGLSESTLALRTDYLDKDAVFLDEYALNTAGNVTGFVEIIRKKGFRKPVLATQAVHARRTAATLLAKGIPVVVSPAWEDIATPLEPADFIPSRNGYDDANRVAIAYAAILKYLIQGHFQWEHLLAIK